MSEKSIDQYITEWLDGDDTAYNYIFDYYYDRLYITCYRAVKIKEDCEEIVMNVFLNIWRRRKSLSHIGDIEKYIFRSLRNQIADFHRKNVLSYAIIENIPLERLGNATNTELNNKEIRQIYLHALEKLPLKKKEIFLMSRELGLNQRQIACIKNISIHTVNNQISSAVKALRNDLDEYLRNLLFILIASDLISLYIK